MNAHTSAQPAGTTCLHKHTGVLFSPGFKAAKVCSTRIWYLLFLKESASTVYINGGKSKVMRCGRNYERAGFNVAWIGLN